MPSVQLKLKKVSSDGWQLFAPKGHAIGPVFRNSELHRVREAARLFVSSWNNWTVDDSDCYGENEIRYNSAHGKEVHKM